MKIAIIGATGYVGSAILNEALDRGCSVIAFARHIEKLPVHKNLEAKKIDVTDARQLAESLKGVDAVISAFNGFNASLSTPEGYQQHIKGVRAIIQAVRQANVGRLLVVGGAGSLEVSSGVRLLDTPEFPKEWQEMARAMTEMLEILKQEKTLNWTYLSPAAMLQPGRRTGKFRLGGDQFFTDAKGNSEISTQDYAVAMLDELELAQHLNKRFSVAY